MTQSAPIQPALHIDSEVTRRIRQHARAHMKTEVCGILIGERIADTIHIRASIEALNAAQAGTHVTFTQDAWETIYKVKDELYPDDRIIGWYHSHPGFGVFLSEHDLFIQQNFFSAPDQVAWVYDPHTDEEGCFGWVGTSIHRLATLTITDNNGDGTARTPKPIESTLDDPEEDTTRPILNNATRPVPAWMRWGIVLMTHLSVLVLGFAIAYLFFPRILGVLVDPLTGEPILRDGRPILTRPESQAEHQAAPADNPFLNHPAQPTPQATPQSPRKTP